MTKIDIISGFLGAGKTTLINKLIKEGYKGEKLVLIENEFGDIGIDGGFLQDAGINITEMNSGCICCSLVGDFGNALRKVIREYHPDRVLIEPSGVGKLSDVMKAVRGVETDEVKLNCHTVVVDAGKCKMYMKNFGEFFNDQIEHASCIIFSHADKVSEDKLHEAVKLVREHNETARIISTAWAELDAAQMLYTMEGANSIEEELHEMLEHHHEHHHHHHHHEGEECHCHDHEHEEHHHHHHDGEECHCHDHEHEEHHHHHHEGEECHHHHHEGEECHCHDHEHEEHHHHDGEECHCHDHEHGHHHHHHADEVFTSWGRETVKAYNIDGMKTILSALSDEEKYGTVLRAKGIVKCECGKWIHFDYVPGEPDVRTGSAAVIGKICVIGANLNESAVAELFGVN
ncbi:MAG: GTP-binding protein [Clostridia bacterium]|nr:GTP-binding protein [Clostridia bacterium]